MTIFHLIKRMVKIGEVVGEYTALKRFGTYYKGLCPLHHEKTPSFTVTPDLDIFYCFGCHAGGDVVSFIAQIERCSQREAAAFLIQKYNLKVPETERAAFESLSELQHHASLCTFLALWLQKQFAASERARAYVASRDLTEQSIAQFAIGYFPGGDGAKRELLRALKKEGFLVDDLLNIKFLIAGKHGYYSHFEERIIFPIKDHNGRVCGFGGRIFHPNDDRAKYYNSHDHPFFTKGTLLFGLDLAKRAIQKTGHAYLVEGYLDCITLVQAGYTNTIATLGTACSAEHLARLSRHTARIYAMYDGDRAGLDATLRLGELCWEAGIDLSIITTPAGDDPDSFIRQGGTLEQLAQQNLFAFYITNLKHTFTTAPLSTKMELIRHLLLKVDTVRDPLKRELLLQQISQATGIATSILARELRPLPVAAATNTPSSAPKIKTLKEINRFAEALFCAILHYEEPISEEDIAIINQLLSERLRTIWHAYTTYKQEASGTAFSDFFAAQPAPEQAYITELFGAHPDYARAISPELFGALLKRCYMKQWKEELHLLQQAITAAHAERDHALVEQLVEKFTALKVSMKQRGLL